MRCLLEGRPIIIGVVDAFRVVADVDAEEMCCTHSVVW